MPCPLLALSHRHIESHALQCLHCVLTCARKRCQLIPKRCLPRCLRVFHKELSGKYCTKQSVDAHLKTQRHIRLNSASTGPVLTNTQIQKNSMATRPVGSVRRDRTFEHHHFGAEIHSTTALLRVKKKVVPSTTSTDHRNTPV